MKMLYEASFSPIGSKTSNNRHPLSIRQMNIFPPSSLILTIAICVPTGCSESPPPNFETGWAEEQKSSQSDVDFTWPVQEGFLLVNRPIPFAFIQQMDPQQLCWPKWNFEAKLDLAVFPPELHRHLQDCFSETEHSLAMMMQVPEDYLAGKCSFALSRSGIGLVTVADQMRIWDIRTGKMIGAPKALPSANITAVTLDRSEKHVLVADDEKIYRLSIPGGEVANSIERPAGDIRQWQHASTGDLICAVTKQGDLFIFNDDLTQLQRFPKHRNREIQRVAINANGTELLVLDRNNLSTIPLQGTRFGEEFPIVNTAGRDFLLCNDNETNYLFGDLYFSQSPTVEACRTAYGGKGMSLDRTTQFQRSAFLWHCIDAAIPIDKGTSWQSIVVLSQRQTKRDQRQYVLSEVLPQTQGMSCAAALPECEAPTAIQLSETGRRVAVYDSGKVRVYRRNKRHFRDTELLRELAGHLIRQGTIEQIEAFANFLSRQGNTHFDLNPSELYAHFIADAGLAWARLQYYHPDATEQLAMLDKWHRHGSEAALLISSKRFIDFALLTHYKFDPKFMTAIQKDLAKLNTGTKPNTLANHFLTLAEAKAVKLDSMELRVRRSLQSDATFFPTLYDVAYFVKPNMIQTKEDYPLYAGAIANLHGDRGDRIYAKLIAAVANSLVARIIAEYPFDTERLNRGTRALIQDNQTNADFLLGLGCIAATHQQRDLAEEILQHLKQQIGFVPLKTKGACNIEAFILYVDPETEF